MNKPFDKKFLEFPLSCFIYCSGAKEKLRDIINYCVVDESMNMVFDEEMIKKIELSFVKSNDFDISNPIHVKIVLTAKKFGVDISEINEVINNWIEIKTFILDYEQKFDKDAYCRIGKQLTLDVIEGRFSFREYSILSAIQSILGKRKVFRRITYEQISYRALGYKSKKVAIELGRYNYFLSCRQIKISVLKLMEKKLITSVTYLFREKYYSTKIKSAARLRELIAIQKIKNAERRNGIEDYKWSKKTQQELTKIRKVKEHYNWLNIMSGEAST